MTPLQLAASLVLAATAEQPLDTPWSVSSDAFSCIAPDATHDGVIKLTKAVDAGDELGVATPSGDFFFLVTGRDAPAGDLPVSSAQLALMEKLEVPTHLLGHSSLKQAQEKIFAESGQYKFHLSDNLESELGGFVCAIELENDRQ
jgi:hypothetical protein